MAHTDDPGNVRAHISSTRFNAGILAVLLMFTGLTYVLGGIDLGATNLALAIVIATIKATLVVLFFMHMRWEKKFNALVFISALLFGGVFLAYTLNETEHRGQIDPERESRISPTAGLAPGAPANWEQAYNAPSPLMPPAPATEARAVEPLPLTGELRRTALPAPPVEEIVELGDPTRP